MKLLNGSDNSLQYKELNKIKSLQVINAYSDFFVNSVSFLFSSIFRKTVSKRYSEMQRFCIGLCRNQIICLKRRTSRMKHKTAIVLFIVLIVVVLA